MKLNTRAYQDSFARSCIAFARLAKTVYPSSAYARGVKRPSARARRMGLWLEQVYPVNKLTRDIHRTSTLLHARGSITFAARDSTRERYTVGARVVGSATTYICRLKAVKG